MSDVWIVVRDEGPLAIMGVYADEAAATEDLARRGSSGIRYHVERWVVIPK
jgi:hypothetical protein